MGVNSCKIDSNTMIATRTLILTASHDREAGIMQGTAIHKPVTIGDNVWIGGGAIILSGVTIRSGAVVGAGSVTSYDIKANLAVEELSDSFIRNQIIP